MTQKEIIHQIKEAEHHLAQLRSCYDLEYLKMKKNLTEYEEQWRKRTQHKRDSLRQEINMLKGDLKAAREARELKLPRHIEEWLDDYHKGVNWGSRLRIRWIDPEELWAIITSGGSTAGQGTAMGTGGYYYAEASHFLGYVPQAGCFENQYGRIEGRLTNERKAKMIASIPEIMKSPKFLNRRGKMNEKII